MGIEQWELMHCGIYDYLQCKDCQSLDLSDCKTEGNILTGKTEKYLCRKNKIYQKKDSARCYRFNKRYSFIDEYPDYVRYAVYWWVNNLFNTTCDEDEEDYKFCSRHMVCASDRDTFNEYDQNKLKIFAITLADNIMLQLEKEERCLIKQGDSPESEALQAAADSIGVSRILPKAIMNVTYDEVTVATGEETNVKCLWSKSATQSRQ